MTKSARNLNVNEHDDTIDLSLSDLSEVPVKDIAVYKRATTLDLSNNKISSLGANFGLLSHLVKLDLSKNQIRILPESFGKLVNLKHLDLYNNQLEHLPLQMGQLRSLRYLDLKGNPLTTGLAMIVGPCLTVQECQNAAKKIVPFLARLQVQIGEDRDRLKKEKALHDAEVERIQLEQQQKQQHSADVLNGNPAEDVDGQEKRISTKTKPKRQRKLKELEVEKVGDNRSDRTTHGDQDGASCNVNQHVGRKFFSTIALLVVALVVALLAFITAFFLVRDADKDQSLGDTLMLMSKQAHGDVIVPLCDVLMKCCAYLAENVGTIVDQLSNWMRA